jgi:hypothetical protein
MGPSMGSGADPGIVGESFKSWGGAGRMSLKHGMRSYFYAAMLLHFITIMELLAMVFLVPVLVAMPQNESVDVVIKIAGMLLLFCLPILAQLDARSRFQNYKQFGDQFCRYGFDRRILKPAVKSRCQRDAALFAAREAGFKDECTQYLRFLGYRWYHLLPEFLFRRPGLLFTPYFWRTTFFLPTYRSPMEDAGCDRLKVRGTHTLVGPSSIASN